MAKKTTPFRLGLIGLDLRWDPPVHFWFGEIERFYKTLRARYGTMEVESWQQDDVRIADKEHNVRLQIELRHVRLIAEEPSRKNFIELSRYVLGELQEVFGYREYARIACIVRVLCRFDEQDAANQCVADLLLKKGIGLTGLPPNNAMQWWTEADDEYHIRRSLKMHRVSHTLGPDNKADEETAKVIGAKLGHFASIEYDRFIETSTPHSTFDVDDYVDESVEEMKQVLSADFQLTEIKEL